MKNLGNFLKIDFTQVEKGFIMSDGIHLEVALSELLLDHIMVQCGDDQWSYITRTQPFTARLVNR